MRTFNLFKGTKGFITTWERVTRFQHMRNEKEVRRRTQILDFWHVHGLSATKDAFSVSRPTLFRWQKVLAEHKGHLTALDPKSTAPKRRRTRRYNLAYIEQVIALRRAHPRIGKKKLSTLLHVSESYAGRTLTDLKKRQLIPQRVPLSLYAKSGKLHERTSTNTPDFLHKVRVVFPFSLREIQTDNGSDFAKYFHEACERSHLVHYHTYPRSPKMNAYIERFNRTLSEDFIQQHRGLLPRFQNAKFQFAEGVGFEPTVPCETLVFKTSAIDHSATPPRASIHYFFLRP